MAALICPTTGAIVDASGESYELLVKAGYKPANAENGPQIANDKPTESPKRRAKRATATE